MLNIETQLFKNLILQLTLKKSINNLSAFFIDCLHDDQNLVQEIFQHFIFKTQIMKIFL